MNVVEASGLGKRYGGTWALRECSLAIPAGHVAALVGPNGAGKSTLLNLAVGLAVPSAGGVTVLGGRPPGSPAALDGIAFVAQDMPLYKNLSAADMLHLTRKLNRHFDQASAEARLGDLGIPLKRKAGKMSGGQQAQLALTLALARRPPRPVDMPNGRWCMSVGARHRPTCWFGPRRTIRSRRAGRRIRSAWKNSPSPTCASPTPQRCPARRRVGTPIRRR
jgi:predicted ABC-type transport system involved in lysophospholipase L1 biosynthesis ATPase subunit